MAAEMLKDANINIEQQHRVYTSYDKWGILPVQELQGNYKATRSGKLTTALRAPSHAKPIYIETL